MSFGKCEGEVTGDGDDMVESEVTGRGEAMAEGGVTVEDEAMVKFAHFMQISHITLETVGLCIVGWH